MEQLISFMPPLLKGVLVTLEVSFTAFALSLVLGLAIGLARMARLAPVRLAAAAYIQFIRGTPLLLQLFTLYYVLPYAGILVPPFIAGVIGLGMNYSAYMAEVFRSGIQAVPRGQAEAAAAVGMTHRLAMRRILIPQAIRIVIPSLGNFFVSMFKDSSLVSVITMRDLMLSGQMLASATFKHIEIFALVALLYLAISYPAAKLVDGLEKRLDVNQRGLAKTRKPAA
jgi:ectoine/hydroxyectoine ABC transporter permease protein EhuD